MKNAIVALNVPRRDNDILVFARSVALAMKDNPYFPSPTFPIADLEALVAETEEAQAYVLVGPIGSAAARNAKLAALWGALQRLRTYVQVVAGESPGLAHAVIESAGMNVKRTGARHKPLLEARPGPVSGSALLLARSAGDRATYEWQFRKRGDVVVDAEPTRKAKTVLRGLEPSLYYEFRVRSVTREGRSDFGDIVSLMVP